MAGFPKINAARRLDRPFRSRRFTTRIFGLVGSGEMSFVVSTGFTIFYISRVDAPGLPRVQTKSPTRCPQTRLARFHFLRLTFGRPIMTLGLRRNLTRPFVGDRLGGVHLSYQSADFLGLASLGGRVREQRYETS